MYIIRTDADTCNINDNPLPWLQWESESLVWCCDGLDDTAILSHLQNLNVSAV